MPILLMVPSVLPIFSAKQLHNEITLHFAPLFTVYFLKLVFVFIITFFKFCQTVLHLRVLIGVGN